MWGIEFDGSWASVNKTMTFDPNGPVGGQETLTNRLDAILTARLRGGVAPTGDDLPPFRPKALTSPQTFQPSCC